MGKYIFTVREFNEACAYIAKKLPKYYESIYAVPKGAYPLAYNLSNITGLPIVTRDNITEWTLVVDDIIDSGKTRNKFPHNDFACLHWKKHAKIKTSPVIYWRSNIEDWIEYWWEEDEAPGEDAVTRLLEMIGEDPNREGLIDTPKRFIKAYGKLFEGYKVNPKDLLTVFTAHNNQMVLLKDIEIYSMCEHHILPFIGKAHIAYIPDEKIIGISKLARIAEMFARRLQIQERLGDQITDTLMEHLRPVGAACIISAEHLCMRMRGVEKQNSVMTTSSLRGVFLQQDTQGLAARNELMNLINMT